MKFKFDFKKKNATMDFGVEELVEKGMEQSERTWKEKFSFKHKAKKEMVEIKHKNKLDVEDKKQKRKTRYQIKQEEKRKNKELEFKQKLIVICIMCGIMIFFIILAILGSTFGW